MKENQKLETVIVGVTGEYFVAGELSSRGHIASITLRNTRGIDIIASNKEGSKSVTIQVKASSSPTNSWILNKKSEEFFSDNHFYVFVNLAKPGIRSAFFIVPSAEVAKQITQGHQDWLNKTGRKGKAHQDNPMRQFSDKDNKYLEAWDIIDNYLIK